MAFVLYALGQTYYWPCVLGFTSERYPRGGALTLNTVSAIGLLSAGVIGGPILGAAFDQSIHDSVVVDAPALAENASAEGGFMWKSPFLRFPHRKLKSAYYFLTSDGWLLRGYFELWWMLLMMR